MVSPALSYHGRAGTLFYWDEEVIEKILHYLGLWDLKVRPPPKAKGSSVTIPIDESDFQVPFSAPSFYPDPGYSVNPV
jgi:hypothetical protein